MARIGFVLLAFALLVPAAHADVPPPAAGATQPASPAGTGEVIARVGFPAPIAAHAGWLAWSERDGATGPFHLVLRAPGGAVSRPAVPPRSVPFDVDLGPGAGGVVAAYSRCTTEPPPSSDPTPTLYERGRGCAPYLLDVATGAERRVTTADAPDASEVWPSPWRGALAFERVYDHKRAYPYLYVGRSDRAARSQRMPGGARKGCRPSRSTGRVACANDRHSRATGVELYGRRLAFAWTYAGLGEALDTEIRLDTIGGGHEVVSHQHGGGLTQVELGWPAFEADMLLWSRECYGDPGGCPRRFGLERRPILGGAVERAAGPQIVISHERDGGVEYVLTDTEFGSCQADPPRPQPTCELRRMS